MDVDFNTLKITGHGDQPVPNQFVRQRGETSTLAVLLPGQGYTARMPLFYYPEQIALERGWDVLSVDYAYPPLEYDDDLVVRQRNLEGRKREIKADVDAAFEAGIVQRDYDRLLLIGKSLGTRAMDHLLSRELDQDIWNVWFTPLINELAIRRRVEEHPGKTFVAIGTDDFAYDEDYFTGLRERGETDVVVIEGADHSMDIRGDIGGSIRAMGEVMTRLDGFLPPV